MSADANTLAVLLLTCQSHEMVPDLSDFIIFMMDANCSFPLTVPLQNLISLTTHSVFAILITLPAH